MEGSRPTAEGTGRGVDGRRVAAWRGGFLAPLLLLALLVGGGCRSSGSSPAVYPDKISTSRGEFIVAGDTRAWIFGEFWRAPAGRERRAVFAKLAEEAPDFVLNTGDLVEIGGDASAWARFDDETAALRDKGVAYVPALGNHDVWPNADAGLANWFPRFPVVGGKRWYGLHHGYVDLLVLDSNDQTLTAAQTAEQEAWFRDRLAADDADPAVRCVFVALHHAPYTNSLIHGQSQWVIREFVEPARASAKVKAFFTGHVHSYEHFEFGGVHFVVSGGGGAPLMDVEGPKGKLHDLYDGPRGHHFVRVIERPDRVDMEVEMLGGDGSWFRADTWSIPLEPSDGR